MNRRGMDAGEGFVWIFRLLVALVLFGLLVGQIVMITGQRPTPHHLELTLYRERLLTGPNGIFLKEGTGRVLSGIVEEDAFLNNRRLDEAYVPPSAEEPEKKVYGCRMRLYRDAAALAKGEAFHEIYNDEAMTRAYLPLATAGLDGPGGAILERNVYPIMMKRPDGALVPVFLDVEVIKRT